MYGHSKEFAMERDKSVERFWRSAGYERTPEIKMIYDGADLVIELNGIRVAQRGEPGGPDAKRWIGVDPRYEIKNENGLEIILKKQRES
jgi:hypothetical protein